MNGMPDSLRGDDVTYNILLEDLLCKSDIIIIKYYNTRALSDLNSWRIILL